MRQMNHNNTSESRLAVVDEQKNRFCGAIKNNGEKCLQDRGHSTSHPGVGRCNWHEDNVNGSALAPYRIPALEERMEEFMRDKNIYSLDREIALNRAYLELLWKQIQVVESVDYPLLKELDISYTPAELTAQIVRLTDNIRKLVESKHEIEVGRKFVVDVRVVSVMFDTMGDILDKNIDDVELRNKISKDLGQLILPMGAR